jgi:NAD(P)H-hydrate epimerase
MPTPVLSIAQVRAWEAATWATGQTEETVISNVGAAVANKIHFLTSPGDRILLLAGKGHNGDDARAAAPHLPERVVELIVVTNPAEQLQALRAAFARRPALVVDGLFGIGLNRPLDHAWCEVVAALNDAKLTVLAVDTPSGLHADTGEPLGAAVRASVTLTVGAVKQGLVQATAWPYVGRLEVATDVGLAQTAPSGSGLVWVLASDFVDFPPIRRAATHKGDYGHLAVIAGSLGYHGAGVLATHAAQRAHPGLVTLHTMPEVYAPSAAQLQAAMVRPWKTSRELSAHFSAVLIGPGLAAPDAAAEFKPVLRMLWQELPAPVVVDASALDWLPTGPTPMGALRVITPHPGEAARLLKTTPESLQADRPSALREISRRFGDCWVVLKGHQTIIGRSVGEIAINSSGNPGLAQGGSGDVLAGYIAGLLAQPGLQSDAERTLRYAVWQHGATADWLAGRRKNWIVDDLARRIGATP